jgi:hypothetical protein
MPESTLNRESNSKFSRGLNYYIYRHLGNKFTVGNLFARNLFLDDYYFKIPLFYLIFY